MKNLKIVIASLLIMSGVIAFSSFSTESFNKNAFSLVCFKYNGTHPASPSEIALSTNWSSLSPTSITTTCEEEPRLCAICFETDDFSTTQAALNVLSALVQADDDDNFYDVITTNGQVITDPSDPDKTITVYLKP